MSSTTTCPQIAPSVRGGRPANAGGAQVAPVAPIPSGCPSERTCAAAGRGSWRAPAPFVALGHAGSSRLCSSQWANSPRSPVTTSRERSRSNRRLSTSSRSRAGPRTATSPRSCRCSHATPDGVRRAGRHGQRLVGAPHGRGESGCLGLQFRVVAVVTEVCHRVHLLQEDPARGHLLRGQTPDSRHRQPPATRAHEGGCRREPNRPVASETEARDRPIHSSPAAAEMSAFRSVAVRVLGEWIGTGLGPEGGLADGLLPVIPTGQMRAPSDHVWRRRHTWRVSQRPVMS